MLKYIVVATLFVAPAIAVPSTNATCVDEFWSFNSRGQSPCLVTAYLAAQCTTDNTFSVDAVNGDGPYGFNSSAANNCICNSVVWNLISACALCQNGTAGSWGQWTGSCLSNYVNVGRYPIPLPSGVAVPSWAYYDFTLTGVFNAVLASQQTGLESSSVFSATSTSTVITTTSTVLTPTPTPTETQTRSNSNTGAIVGGTIGGVLGLGLIALVGFVLLRKRKPKEPAAAHSETSHKPPMAARLNQETPMGGYASGYQYGAPNQPEYKPYDPSDPSTFPTGPATSPGGHYPGSLPYSYRPQDTQGQRPYPSAPQV